MKMNNYSTKITLLYGIYNGTRMIVGAINTLFLLKQGVTLGDIALLQMIFSISVFVLEIPTGMIADTISRKVSVILSCVCLIFYYPIYYLGTPNIYVLGIMQFVYALSLCLISGAFEGWQTYIVKLEYPDNIDKINYYGHMKYEINAFVTMFSGTLGSLLVYLGGKNYSFLYFFCGIIMLMLVYKFCRIPSDKDKTIKTRKQLGIEIARYFGELKKGLSICFISIHGWAYLLGVGALCCTYQIVYYYWQAYFNYLSSKSSVPFWINKEELLLGIVFFMYSFTRFLLNRFVRKKIIEHYNVFSTAIVCLLIASISMYFFSMPSTSNLIIYILLFSVIQGSTILVESIFESQFIKKCNDDYISCNLSITSALTSVISVVFLYIISQSINEDNMNIFFRSTIAMYLFIVLIAFIWSINYNKEKKE